jgi:hypothetical protein
MPGQGAGVSAGSIPAGYWGRGTDTCACECDCVARPPPRTSHWWTEPGPPGPESSRSFSVTPVVHVVCTKGMQNSKQNNPAVLQAGVEVHVEETEVTPPAPRTLPAPLLLLTVPETGSDFSVQP